jgi:hypothetical protein
MIGRKCRESSLPVCDWTDGEYVGSGQELHELNDRFLVLRFRFFRSLTYMGCLARDVNKEFKPVVDPNARETVKGDGP